MTPERMYGEFALHRLLVAVDGSGNADLAVDAAVAVALRDNAKLTLITVGADLATAPASWSVPLGATLDQGEIDADGHKRLAEIVEKIPDELPVHTIYRRGKAGYEIVKASREGDYDAILLGARGVGRVGALMGSVSSYVLHHADVAVFVAHAPREKGEKE